QRRLQLAIELLAVAVVADRPEHRVADDPALAVHDVGDRESRQRIRPERKRLTGVEDDRVRHSVGAQEAAGIAFRIRAVNPQNYDAVGAIAPPERLEIGGLPL